MNLPAVAPASLLRTGFILLALVLAGCPDDTEPPFVVRVYPADGDTVFGIVTVEAFATDNRGVVAVDLLVDDEIRTVDSSASRDTFRLAWNSSVVRLDTLHELVCEAWDRAGNSARTDPISIFVTAGTRHSGAVTSDETWSLASSPHVVEGDLQVRAVLTVESGCHVLMSPGASIIVGLGLPGALRAVGRTDSVITFTAMPGSPRPGDWRALDFRSAPRPESSVLRHCTVSWGGSKGAMVLSQDAAVRLDSCILSRSQTAGVSGNADGFAGITACTVDSCAGLPLLLDPNNVDIVGPGNSFAGNVIDGIGVLGGQLGDSADWSDRGFPYCITGTMTVAGEREPVLSVAPACSLLFADSAALRVGLVQTGTVKANGSYGRITFGLLSTAPGSETWPGIEFWEHSGIATLLHQCVVDRAGNSGAAAIKCRSPVTISSTTVQNSASSGVLCDNTGFLTPFQNNTVTGCAGYPLVIPADHVGSVGTGNRLTGNSRDSIEVGPGRVRTSALWLDHGVPYFIRGSIEVGSSRDPTLSVHQGAELVFDATGSNAALVVGRDSSGTFYAVGDPDSITFTGSQPESGSWRGIEIYELGRNSTLERCRLLYGGGNGQLGIVYVWFCEPYIRHNRFAHTPNYCLALFYSNLEEDSLLAWNEFQDFGSDEPIFIED